MSHLAFDGGRLGRNDWRPQISAFPLAPWSIVLVGLWPASVSSETPIYQMDKDRDIEWQRKQQERERIKQRLVAQT